MRTDHESFLTSRWIVFGTALVYFALGSVLTAHFMRLKETWTDSHRTFQLKIHHDAVPPRMPVLEERVRCASALQARHALAAAGYWIPEAAKITQRNRALGRELVYLLSRTSQEKTGTNFER
jgi:hypothetical protein